MSVQFLPQIKVNYSILIITTSFSLLVTVEIPIVAESKLGKLVSPPIAPGNDHKFYGNDHKVPEEEDEVEEVNKFHQTVQDLFEEEEDLLNMHMSVIQENAELLTEEGRLLQQIQGENNDIDSYAARLDRILQRKQELIVVLREKLEHFRNSLVKVCYYTSIIIIIIIIFTTIIIIITQGIPLIKHNNGNLNKHLTILKISDKELFFRSRFDIRKDEDELWNKFSLFRLKFIIEGQESDSISRKFLNPKFSFEMMTDDRGSAINTCIITDGIWF